MRSEPRQDRLLRHLPAGYAASADEILERFLDWMREAELEPYPAQEDAFLELMADRHVILGTPTGSGKSMVAALLHFKALAEGQRSFYACPTKALASEKFFWLCEQLGADRVGMLTGDAAINPGAPVICCTTEVLANMALAEGPGTDAPYVVIDEFHFYGDRDRGMAFQVPLLELDRTLFLLMSATLGDTTPIRQALEQRSNRPVAEIHGTERPVPLDFEYRETQLLRTVSDLLDEEKGPIYIVHFTQREAGERAQALTSAGFASKQRRARIRAQIGDFRFDSPYGADVRRVLRFGVGLHHAGLLPKYRLLVEQLAQQGLLDVICGTDTLGVGVNIPIRTVLFSRLTKFDGEKVGVLKVREFHQIAGRAGRRGFDDRGSVVCQAPEHVIEKRRAEQRGRDARRRVARRKPPRGFVPWNRQTFEKLIYRAPEPLVSSFRITHGAMILVLQREGQADAAQGYRGVIELLDRSHESAARKRRLRRDAARLFRALRQAGVVEVYREPGSPRRRVRVHLDLQDDFSLHHALSLYVVDATAALDRDSPSYALEVLSVVEAILENPMAILIAQRDRARSELMAVLKAERVPFEERLARLDEVGYPEPEADFIRESFAIFAARHPWVEGANVRPKGIAREMFESYASFADYVRRQRIGRSEGLLLRYLGEVYKALLQNVPEPAKTPAVYDVIAYLRATIEPVDSSLLREWEGLLAGEGRSVGRGEPGAGAVVAGEPPLLEARVRAELHRLVRALAARDYAAAAACVRSDAAADAWDASRIEAALAPFFASYEAIRFDAEARFSEHQDLRRAGPQRLLVSQVLLDPVGDHFWHLAGEVDLDAAGPGPLVRLLRIGT